ncbi:MAG TPA: hypothetical protein VMB52_06725 [Verrucomicrobiae bacterium]|nr:hypothetical protein [Verrucomicrobiae bacterium]
MSHKSEVSNPSPEQLWGDPAHHSRLSREGQHVIPDMILRVDRSVGEMSRFMPFILPEVPSSPEGQQYMDNMAVAGRTAISGAEAAPAQPAPVDAARVAGAAVMQPALARGGLDLAA